VLAAHLDFFLSMLGLEQINKICEKSRFIFEQCYLLYKSNRKAANDKILTPIST
jgi:hypothetical protein